jgi:Xaa-Pro aminopeptidase
MIVSVEPGVATEYGTFHVEENVVVREDGCELLSTSPRSLARLVLRAPQAAIAPVRDSSSKL